MIDRKSNVFMVVCMALVLLVSIMLYMCKMPYSSLCGGVFFFMACLCTRHALKFDTLWIRHVSMWIFYTHMIVLYFYFMLMRCFDCEIPTTIKIIGAYIPVIAFGCIITALSRRWPRLNYLIN